MSFKWETAGIVWCDGIWECIGAWKSDRRMERLAAACNTIEDWLRRD